MGYFILGSIICILIILLILQLSKRRSADELHRIRSMWATPKSKDNFHFVRIGNYATLIGKKFHRLTDQTIEDIDFNRLFTFIDRTTSKVGQQFLYKKLLEPTADRINSSDNLIQLFAANHELREKVQLELLKLSDDDAYTISSLLQDIHLEKPKWYKFLVPNVILALVLVILSFKFPILIICLVVITVVNMYLHLWNKNNTFFFTRSVPQLNILISVASLLLKRSELPYDKSVEESIIKMKSFQNHASLIRFRHDGVHDDIMQYLFDLIKGFFLIEILVIYKMANELREKRSAILLLFEYVGAIDASISIANLRAGKLRTCQPVFTDGMKDLNVKNVYHPLIKNCTTNSLKIKGKSILLTGSNMSGKSTFLRTIAINSILAQTINTCFADEFISPILKQFSSIRIDDNLFEGKSYYFQEVSLMGSLLSQVKPPNQSLFILDEVFKGTNTVERIAAAKAILSYLNRNENIVIVSTHDIELADLLQEEYDLYHFTEIVESSELHFDYKIKHGQLQTRNAIRILELANYPDEIISEARSLSNEIVKKKL